VVVEVVLGFLSDSGEVATDAAETFSSRVGLVIFIPVPSGHKYHFCDRPFRGRKKIAGEGGKE
jgi:hypothetical protein